jgi:hypothetical protein
MALVAAAEAGLGRFFFAPKAIAELEATVEANEISRWPCGPYQVARNYWRNQVAVRKRLDDLGDALRTQPEWEAFLRELHVVYLLGGELDCFYRPASESSMLMARAFACAPGQIQYQRDLTCPMSKDFIPYFRLLASTVHDPFAASDHGPIVDGDGFIWGYYFWDWDVDDSIPRHTFRVRAKLDPTALRRTWQALAVAHEAADNDDEETFRTALPRFLQYFDCLHPFVAGNHGLAMNILNYELRRYRNLYIPALHTDWCAHRFGPNGFQRVFWRIVDTYGVRPGDTQARARMLSLWQTAAALVRSMEGGGADANELAQRFAADANAPRALVLRDTPPPPCDSRADV